MLQHTFIRRRGRTTSAQRRALQAGTSFLFPYEDRPVDFETSLKNTLPIVLEIGFGMGETLVETAAQFQEYQFIGIEVYPPGVGSCLGKIAKKGIKNLIVIQHDAYSVIANMVPDQSLARIHIYFPDPWPKRRHEKRRLIQPHFLRLVHQKLQPKGILHIVTDWEDYSTKIKASLPETLIPYSSQDPFITIRPETKFERKGIDANRPPISLCFEAT